MTTTVWVLVVIAGLVLWAGLTVIFTAWADRRSQPSLSERLRPFHPSVADGAEVWLDGQ